MEEIEIIGRLQVSGETAFIQIAGEEIPVHINVKGFVDRLLSTTPCFVGGDFLYDDDVKLLVQARASDSGLDILTVRSGEIYRAGERVYKI